MAEATKFLLTESQIPTHWYNIKADMTTLPQPPLHPGTKQPIDGSDLAALFPPDLIAQEVSMERWIEIPDEVREIYKIWRPTPLYRARRLEQALQTPAHIYYKYEGVSPVGSHKANTAVPQAYYNKRAGIKRITTETGAGQWGSAMAMASKFFGLECMIYMVKISYEQKPYRRIIMQTFGAQIVASPSTLTQSGRRVLELDPESLGSLGIAISEAVEDAAGRDDTNYALGSVLDHVLIHQSVIGQEARLQMEQAGEYPDVVIGCCGGGSNYAGLAFPFLGDKLTGKAARLRSIAVEPAACPTLTRGTVAYDFGDTIGLTPLLKMYTLGHTFMPSGIHAGGLRYHGDAALVSQLYHDQIIEARAYPQNTCFNAAVQFAQNEGIIPAPESAHAVRAAVDEALDARERGEKRTILFSLSGHGHFDLQAYENYLAGQLVDQPYSETLLQEAWAELPQI